ASVGNDRQKGMSFLKLGMIYYENLKNYKLARDYYDSTIQALPNDYEDYERIKERQVVLDEFVKQINIIQTQDSLLSLAALDSATLMIKLNKIAEDLKTEEKLEKEKRKKRSQNYVSPFDIGQSSTVASSWYFDNPTLVSAGQREFNRKWGTRILEDHWRRSNKSITSGGSSQERAELNTVVNNDTPNQTEENSVENKAIDMYSQLPFTDDQKNKAMDQIEEAYYKLGNIYNFKLNEKDNAGESFMTLLSRFPETIYEPEVLYLLYLIYMESQNELSNTYKNKLLSEYPHSTYSKLIANPAYTEDSNESTAKLKAIYEKAYRLYKMQKFDVALTLINQGLTNYPEMSFSARLRLLRILIIGRTEDIGNYKYELGKFITENPDSDVTEYAKTLLASSEDFEIKLTKLKGIRYIEDFAQSHYFALIYDASEGLTDRITSIVETFNSTEFKTHNLTTSNLTYNGTQALILVTEFEGIELAIQYFSKFSTSENEIEVLSNSKIHTFVITKDNFGIFYQNKGLEEYNSFFNKNYN
ncbi:MAG: tetratricopeptide repeat protein, partial [Cyclobacteriaceae bacterium]|nr:tetratricopeptide repeat protein [Cyclobacteriaceae bacterium]